MKVNTNTVKNQAGFSLVELMVVVAIIGILAAVAVPQFQNFQAKARQAEAKTLLSSYYTAQQTFFTEFNTFHNQFNVVPFRPSGQMRYNIGTNLAADAVLSQAELQAAGFTAAPAGAADVDNTFEFCGTAAGGANGCQALSDSNPAAAVAGPLGTRTVIDNGAALTTNAVTTAVPCDNAGAAASTFGRVGAAGTWIAQSFVVEARSAHNRARSGNVDAWRIDSNKNLVNCLAGVL